MGFNPYVGQAGIVAIDQVQVSNHSPVPLNTVIAKPQMLFLILDQRLNRPSFQIVSYYCFHRSTQVIGKIRREEWNKARADKDDKNAKVIKGQRYNLLRRPENNTDRQQARLDELLAMNEPLSKVYVLVEDFRDALSQNYVGHAKNCLKLWIETAISSGIKAVVKFAKSLEKFRTR